MSNKATGLKGLVGFALHISSSREGAFRRATEWDSAVLLAKRCRFPQDDPVTPLFAHRSLHSVAAI